MSKPRHWHANGCYLVVLMAATVIACLSTGSAAAPASSAPVLGVKGLMPGGHGWGRVRPREIFNGGAPSGLAQDIRWRGWGSPTARGTGRHPTYRPEGGYFKSLGVIQLKATRLGTCARAPGKRAYTRLIARSQTRPRGPFGDWFPWTLDLCDLAAEPEQCESVGFEPNSDYGAFEITAWDTSCATAQAVAGASRSTPITRGSQQYRLRTNGFVCRGYSFESDELPSITWNCSRNTAVVTFKRS